MAGERSILQLPKYVSHPCCIGLLGTAELISLPHGKNLLSDTDKIRLDRIQRSAAQIMLPFSEGYEHRLDNLALLTISTFLHNSCSEYFTKIADDDHQPLNSRIKVNTNRRAKQSNLILIITDQLNAEQPRVKTLLWTLHAAFFN